LPNLCAKVCTRSSVFELNGKFKISDYYAIFSNLQQFNRKRCLLFFPKQIGSVFSSLRHKSAAHVLSDMFMKAYGQEFHALCEECNK